MGKCDFCQQKDGTKSCACKIVHYCSQTCQKKHWSTHKRSCLPFAIEDFIEKGKGLVANRNIKFGEKILTEMPLLIIENNSQSSFDNWCNYVVNLVESLSKEKLKKFLYLGDNEFFNKTSEFLYLKGVRKFSEECVQYIRIVRTNGINIDEAGNRTGIFNNFSRINHSCAPNSVRNIISDKSGEMSVIAARDIQMGEEITIKYFDLETASLLKSSRKMKLLNWGFDCHCDICDLKEDALEENEKLRKQLQSAKTALKKCPTDLLDTKSLKQQMTIEKLIIKIIRDLQSQLKAELPDHLMSLHHVCRLLECHGLKSVENVEEIQAEAQVLSTKLGKGFYDQYLYWNNLTMNCCKSLCH